MIFTPPPIQRTVAPFLMQPGPEFELRVADADLDPLMQPGPEFDVRVAAFVAAVDLTPLPRQRPPVAWQCFASA